MADDDERLNYNQATFVLQNTEVETTYIEVGEDGIEFGEREPRRCCDALCPAPLVGDTSADAEVICLRSIAAGTEVAMLNDGGGGGSSGQGGLDSRRAKWDVNPQQSLCNQYP